MGYDREFFLALHDWGGHFEGSDDGSMNPTYEVATINGKMLGFGEPLKVRQGRASSDACAELKRNGGPLDCAGAASI